MIKYNVITNKCRSWTQNDQPTRGRSFRTFFILLPGSALSYSDRRYRSSLGGVSAPPSILPRTRWETPVSQTLPVRILGTKNK